ncbi:fimbria/pilus outer membrane usher protein [Terrihabitans rhizophilus]|uniref:Fimbria/pilus outer membrane usher protein n=1 Tax=Terrihabitans rhizophilus TaxID=3092662 RepID=A0ABU4RRD8_9HYPH|nr:fimbria/pilus outer membrane usher protein [Terrihabitans sp. PJ23]MDX6807411.1 fimbria/pilus outer membrane usher protein [Terrihabitans sp. PJ23]
MPEAAAQVVPALDAVPAEAAFPADLQLEIFINETSTGLIASLRQEANGTLWMPRDQLHNVGIAPPAGAAADGLVPLDALTGIHVRYDEATQALHFTAGDAQRVRKMLDARRRAETPEPQRGTGALVNYTLFANFNENAWDRVPSYTGASGLFDSRVFSSFGTLSQTVVGRVEDDFNVPAFKRLDTSWSYSDPERLATYRAGDLVTSGVSWSRPLRVGGAQMSRNFGLRPDLVTMPVPLLSGSAAVPSTVDVIVNNNRAFSDKVLGGPFQISNLPIQSGPGQARVVVRDVLGRETVQDVSFYATPRLLADGLLDYSVEAGFARSSFGLRSWDYDDTPIASATARYGLNDWLTLESHGEGGTDFINGGLGGVFGLGRFGVGSLAAAASNSGEGVGAQFAGTVQIELGGWVAQFRTQRTLGDYDDAASVTDRARFRDELARHTRTWDPRPAKALDQAALSIPMPFDGTSLNVSLTRLEEANGKTSTLVEGTYSRPLFGGSTGFISAHADIEDGGRYGLFAGLSIPLGPSTSAYVGAQSSGQGTSLTADAVRYLGSAPGDYGWRVRAAKGQVDGGSAAVSYRTSAAKLSVGGQARDGYSEVTAEVEGAVGFMAGDVFFTNRIDDAFAVVDAGVPGVDVMHENRVIGRTGRSGKALVPELRSWDTNEIAIDPTNLPLQTFVSETRQKIVPAESGGVLVRFGSDTGATSALIVLRGADGSPVPVGSTVLLDGASEPAIVGYDGETFLSGLKPSNTLSVHPGIGEPCAAHFDFKPEGNGTIARREVICQ